MTDEDPLQDRIAELIERINQMDAMLRQQAWRLYHLEQRLGVTPPRQAQPGARPPRAAPRATAPPPPAAPPSVMKDTSAPPPAPTYEAAPPPTALPETSAPPRREAMQTMPAAKPPASPPPTRPQAPPPTPPRARVAAPPSFAQARAKSRDDLEARIGGNWFQRIGVFAFALGVAFFLKYAYDSAWISKN